MSSSELQIGDTFIHNKSGVEYIIVARTKLKVNNAWEPNLAVIYAVLKNSFGVRTQYYTRTLEDFIMKFTRRHV